MKKDYFRAIPKPKEIQKQAYSSYQQRIQEVFDAIRLQYSESNAKILKNLLKQQTSCKDLLKEDKAPIFKYFLDKELKQFSCFGGQNSMSLSILKQTKCKIENFKLDWKEVWQNFLKKQPEIHYNKEQSLQSFIKIIRSFFDENNALEVYEYFRTYYPTYKISFIHLFANINTKTKPNIVGDYLKLMRNQCQAGKVRKQELIEIFMMLVFSQGVSAINEEDFLFFNSILVQFLTVPKYPRSEFQSRFKKQNSIILAKIIGKKNPASKDLLNTVFMFLKQFIRPLENSSHGSKFLNIFIKRILKRQQNQEKTKEKLKKLKEKLQKKEEKQEKDDDEESQGKNQEQQNQQQAEQEPNDELKIDENDEYQEKPTTQEQKILKCEAILSNQLSQEIMKSIQEFVTEIFPQIYFVNSENIIPELIRNLYRLFPSLILKSDEMLNKAQEIPNINEEGLIKVITVEAQNLFGEKFQYRIPKRILKILSKTIFSTKIQDVFPIYESICSKIPILDEEDIENIPEEDKTYFQNTFDDKFNRFYEQYSQNVFQAYKRFLSEGEFMQDEIRKKLIPTIEQIFMNSYPKMKKRMITETLNMIVNNPHKCAFVLFLFADLTPNQLSIVENQLSELKSQTKQIEKIKLNLISVLAKAKPLKDLKHYIYEMAQKGNYEPIQEYLKFNYQEYFEWQPFSPSLKYLNEKVPIKLKFSNSEEQLKKILGDIDQFTTELMEKLKKELQQFQSTQNKAQMNQRIIDFYTKSENLKTFKERKKIYDLLSILRKILIVVENKYFIVTKNILKIHDSPFQDIGFLNDKNLSIIKHLMWNAQLMKDLKINEILCEIITIEGYKSMMNVEVEEKKLKKYTNKTKNLQMPQCENRIRFGEQYLSKARIYTSSLIKNSTKLNLQPIKEEIFMLMLINKDDKNKYLFNMLKDNGFTDFILENMINLFKEVEEDRHLLKSLQKVLQNTAKSYIRLSQIQMKELFACHIVLVTCQKEKVREEGIKSFKKIVSIVQYHPMTKSLNQIMKGYLKLEKLEIVWVIWILLFVSSTKFSGSFQEHNHQLKEMMKSLEKLILHELRTTRRMALLGYSMIIRKLKKLNEEKSIVPFQHQQYKQKTIEEFFWTGYLHPQYYQSYLKNKKNHKNYPLEKHQMKKKSQFPSQFFQFLIQSPENSLKFVKNFHSDMASTVQMQNSAFWNSILSVDFSSIATKAIEQTYIYIETSKMKLQRIQLIFGEKFFKYLCTQDARKGFKFFQTVKDYVKKASENLQSLDNQTLVLCYTLSLLKAYEKSYKEKIPQIQQFLGKIFRQIISKSSGMIFKKINMLIFRKIENSEALLFLKEIGEELLEKKTKISRAGEILENVNQEKIQTSIRICKILLDNELQLENPYFQTLINGILDTSQEVKFNIRDIKKTKIINLEKGLSEGKLIENHGYVLRNYSQFYKYLTDKLGSFVDGNLQLCKTGFNLINKILLSCTKLEPLKQNLQFSLELIKLGLKVINNQNQLQLDYETFYKSTSVLVGSSKLPTKVFQPLFAQFLQSIQPKKRCCQLIEQIVYRPSNLMQLSSPYLVSFIHKVLEFESNSLLYKKTIKILSLIFSYAPKSKELLKQINMDTKNKKVLVYQAYSLANIKLDIPIIEQILKLSVKERLNIWAKQMLSIYRKREYFDKEEAVPFWREIKMVSNPYHYHA